MSEQPATAPVLERLPLDERAAASVVAFAAEQRGKVDVLASVVEGIAAYGYPSPETGELWATARDAHLDRFIDEQPRVA
ncbi:hypothetical protein [Streptomyces katrae]|uniref:hypothetical protein n=1 Tax=Streptomyces katrae TaxID=68223 RepID=UPI0004BEA925|nr:hypothetical protein [Streptomyces katrae]